MTDMDEKPVITPVSEERQMHDAMIEEMRLTNKRLGSIHSIMTFFVILAVFALLVSGCNALMALGL